MVSAGGGLGVDGGFGGGYGGALFFEGCALEGLEFAEGGLEFARDLLLGVFLRRLFSPSLVSVDPVDPIASHPITLQNKKR